VVSTKIPKNNPFPSIYQELKSSKSINVVKIIFLSMQTLNLLLTIDSQEKEALI